jgi:probable F420-dependent oxidoreductase
VIGATIQPVPHPLRIGAAIPPYGPTYDDVRQAALAAESVGADSLWTWDHFFQSGASEDPSGPNLECMTVLAALAGATSRASLGALVACNSYRNADLHADMARTIDHVSGGRFVLGIGAGWFEPDYVEYGYAFGGVRDRLDALAEALPRLRARLRSLSPQPVRGHLPLLIAGGGERVLLRLVAEYADIWNCYGTPAELAHKSAILDEHCARVGRDPAEIERTVLLEEDEANHADGYHKAGMTHLIVTLAAPRYDVAQLERLCAWRDRQAA